MKLNPAQELAVKTIEGPVMVIAGPGTGKTQIIAERIAQILKATDTAPSSILALTFTESGVKAMRERLIETIGEAAYYVNINTFHAFCSDVIQEFPDRFSITQTAQALAELERVQIFHQILDENEFNFLKPVNDPYYYTGALVGAIQDLKREGITPPIFKAILKKTDAKTREAKYNLSKNRELAQVFSLYQEALTNRGRYDFEDMINLVADNFKNDTNLLTTYQERFHYFLVDEYQDTNSSQNRVMNLLASFWGEQANVFVVGDPNQSIYRFQGASLENVIEFTKTYPQAKIITLEQNYRSHQLILDASFDLIQKNRLKIEDIVPTAKAKLKAQPGLKTQKLQRVKLPSETVETYWIGQKIKELIKTGVKPETICVLYRHNQDSAALSEMMNKLGIPMEIEGGSNVLVDPVINQLIVLMRAINLSAKNLDDLDMFTLMHYPWFKLDALEILKLARQASKSRSSIVDLILNGEGGERFGEFLTQLSQWQELDGQTSFAQWFENLIKESGFLEWLLTRSDRVNLLNRLNSLFSEIKRLNSTDHELNLSKFLEALELMKTNRLVISEQDLDIKAEAVSLSTAHKAKGKEWDYVFIYKTIDGKWGNNRSRDLIKLPETILTNTDISKKEKNEDERRLFYVALTRAKKQVFLTYAERYLTNTYLKEAIPSMFLTEIPKKYQELVEPRLGPQAAKVLQEWLEPPQHPTPTIEEKDWLKTIVADFKLSATALNTYLQCPYKFKLNVLVRVPRAKEAYLSFGTAVHRALEMFFKSFIKEDRHPGKQYLLAQFEAALSREALLENEHKIRLRQGKQILSAYFDYYHDEFKKPLFVERFFGYGWSKAFLGDIPLTGKMDRIDLLDQKDKTVRVVDYKTGSAKTRNQILGKTQDANLDYIRQLVFYKLLATLDRTFPLKVRETMLDFVEPNKKTGKFKQEKFIISDEQVEELKQTIKDVMKDIRALKFEHTTDYRHCERCEYQRHCWPEGIPQSKNEQLKLV